MRWALALFFALKCAFIYIHWPKWKNESEKWKRKYCVKSHGQKIWKVGGSSKPPPPPHTHGLNGMQRVAQGTNQPFIYHISEGGGGAGSLHGKISGSIKFGGSLEAHQNSGVEVPGSNPASPTMILMRCRITAKNVENLRVERETYR